MDYFELSHDIIADPGTRFRLKNRIIADSEMEPYETLCSASTLRLMAELRLRDEEQFNATLRVALQSPLMSYTLRKRIDEDCDSDSVDALRDSETLLMLANLRIRELKE